MGVKGKDPIEPKYNNPAFYNVNQEYIDIAKKILDNIDEKPDINLKPIKYDDHSIRSFAYFLHFFEANQYSKDISPDKKFLILNIGKNSSEKYNPTHKQKSHKPETISVVENDEREPC